MGTVYRASAADGRIAAVKVLAPDLAHDEVFLGRFRREIEAMQQVSHPHIVEYYDSGNAADVSYLAMEFVGGPNYEFRLHVRGRLAWPEVLAVGKQTAEALKHAHDRGVIHRDLKPANILNVGDPDGQGGVNIKLTDFGVAKLFASPPLTAAGGFVGTAAYLAPEQALGKPPSKRGDLYSLGCVMYALLTGRAPFEGESVTELLHQHRFAQPEQPIRLVPDLPNDINSLVLLLLEKDPGKRPADASVLIRTIDRIGSKMERKARTGQETMIDFDTDSSRTDVADDPESSAQGPGHATFAARFVREELERQNRGGPIARFFNHPAVLVLMFALCVAGIVYGMFRPGQSPEELMAAARPLMASNDPKDWKRATRDYLDPLSERYYDHPFKTELEGFRRRIDDHSAREKAMEHLYSRGPMSEAERFYRQGLQQCQVGDIAAVRRVWRAVVLSFSGMPAEERWVHLAREGLRDLDALKPSDRPAATAAIERARKLKAEGKSAEAKSVLDALEELYSHDPDGEKLLEAIRQVRDN